MAVPEAGRHRVHRKVAAAKVFFYMARVLNLVRVAAVGVIAFGAEGGHFYRLLHKVNGDSSVLDSGRYDAMENFNDFFGLGVGGHVPVVCALSHKLVADGSAHKVSLKARRLKERIHFLQFCRNLYFLHRVVSKTTISFFTILW